jgi:hypothetical protein
VTDPECRVCGFPYWRSQHAGWCGRLKSYLEDTADPTHLVALPAPTPLSGAGGAASAPDGAA